MASYCQQSRAAALMVALAPVALMAALAAAAALVGALAAAAVLAAAALVAALAAAALMAVVTAAALIAALAAACCFGVDSGGDLESWASRATLGLSWALRVRVGPVGSGFASL